MNNLFLKRRSRRPPMDLFNSLISLGYSIILNELYGKIGGKGLNPYFGVMHKDREKHPTLASDLMEEWRAVLIDTTALSMLNGHELVKEDFYTGIRSAWSLFRKGWIPEIYSETGGKISYREQIPFVY
ncbi:MAG: CRISPR-associated endonuclease Cas1 [Roseburia sp.]